MRLLAILTRVPTSPLPRITGLALWNYLMLSIAMMNWASCAKRWSKSSLNAMYVSRIVA